MTTKSSSRLRRVRRDRTPATRARRRGGACGSGRARRCRHDHHRVVHACTGGRLEGARDDDRAGPTCGLDESRDEGAVEPRRRRADRSTACRTRTSTLGQHTRPAPSPPARSTASCAWRRLCALSGGIELGAASSTASRYRPSGLAPPRRGPDHDPLVTRRAPSACQTVSPRPHPLAGAARVAAANVESESIVGVHLSRSGVAAIRDGRAWVDHPSWEVVARHRPRGRRDLESLLLDAPMEELTRRPTHSLATFVLSLVVLDAIERLGLAPAPVRATVSASTPPSWRAGRCPSTTACASWSHAARRWPMRRDAPGTMAALLGISDDDAEAACQRARGDVWVANYNAPGQVVVAGPPTPSPP